MKTENISILKAGGIGVIPTDTVYGLVCDSFSETALSRMFKLKGRAENKPPVVIVSALSDLDLFGIKLNPVEEEIITKYWPGPVTIIFNRKSELNFLDQGLGLAIRLPADEKLRVILKQTGPLATTSANLQGQPPAQNIFEARSYFADRVDFYEDGGNLDSTPSTLVRIKDGKIEVLREGKIKI